MLRDDHDDHAYAYMPYGQEPNPDGSLIVFNVFYTFYPVTCLALTVLPNAMACSCSFCIVLFAGPCSISSCISACSYNHQFTLLYASHAWQPAFLNTLECRCQCNPCSNPHKQPHQMVIETSLYSTVWLWPDWQCYLGVLAHP